MAGVLVDANDQPASRSRRDARTRPYWPPRAPILGAGGVLLTTSAAGRGRRRRRADQGSRRGQDRPGQSWGDAGAGRQRVGVLAKAHPTQFEPVFTRLAAALRSSSRRRAGRTTSTPCRAPSSSCSPRGRRSPSSSSDSWSARSDRSPPPSSSARAAVRQLRRSSVMRGLEQIWQRRLAGTPTTQINVVDSTGSPVVRLATYRGRRGRPVRTSIEPSVQRAAEQALAGDTHHVAMVAMRGSTGKVLAVVSEPGDYEFDRALQGQYPPGSTFKVLTSTALIAQGLTPDVAGELPADDHRRRRDVSQRRRPTRRPSTLGQAFTISCNTAFIGLATAHLDGGRFPAAAACTASTTAPNRDPGADGQRPQAIRRGRAGRQLDRPGVESCSRHWGWRRSPQRSVRTSAAAPAGVGCRRRSRLADRMPADVVDDLRR